MRKNEKTVKNNDITSETPHPSKFFRLQGLACHITRKHTKDDLPYHQPAGMEIADFKKRFLMGIADFLGATPRANLGKSLCAGFVACEKRIFAAIFKAHPTFRYSPDLQTMQVTYKGKPGMQELEAIFGVDFWKFGFKSRAYTYIQFWEQDDRKTPCKFVLKCRTQSRQSYYPIVDHSEDRVFFSFRKRRDQRSAALQARAIPFVIPE